MSTDPTSPWKKSACILCSLNCGIEVQIGGKDDREIIKVRGDDDHPASKGYVCEKIKRLNYYQNGGDRITTPLRRRPDGIYEPISWDTAFTEIAEKFNRIKSNYGGDKILFFGGGGQGNHLGGTYSDSTLKALGVKYRSNALAQEKTGEFWVNGKMLGTGVHGDFEHAEVALFIGKNPWQSHGFARARTVLQEISKTPHRTLIVIDPRRSETADKADFHLAIKPGTDAWCLAALVAIIVQEGLIKEAWLNKYTEGYSEIEPYFKKLNVPEFAEKCGITANTLREVARCVAGARSVSVLEDLGMQMNVHSTLNSYIQRLLWLLTGNFAKKGSNYAPIPFLALNALNKGDVGSIKQGPLKSKATKVSPVTESKIITGLIPCNVIPEEILTDHPNRFRAMLIESANPAHSLADSRKMREALRALELVVVIDVAMTETAREADYVLPTSSQYEKYENSYFNLEFPDNVFHLRQPLFKPLPGTLTEAEIHTRLVIALGAIKESDFSFAAKAARLGHFALIAALVPKIILNQHLMNYLPVILYKTLGPTLPNGAKEASVIWALAHLFVHTNNQAATQAGYGGPKLLAGEKLFHDIMNSPSGLVFASAKDYADSWNRITMNNGKINLVIRELFDELESLKKTGPLHDSEFPLILSAGERRSTTSNTIVRNPEINIKDLDGALHISQQDATQHHLNTGDKATITTHAGKAEVVIEITDRMRPGHISLPNGTGLTYTTNNETVCKGVAPNELTTGKFRDPIAGTPWHKRVPAKLEKCS